MFAELLARTSFADLPPREAGIVSAWRHWMVTNRRCPPTHEERLFFSSCALNEVLRDQRRSLASED